MTNKQFKAINKSVKKILRQFNTLMKIKITTKAIIKSQSKTGVKLIPYKQNRKYKNKSVKNMAILFLSMKKCLIFTNKDFKCVRKIFSFKNRDRKL